MIAAGPLMAQQHEHPPQEQQKHTEEQKKHEQLRESIPQHGREAMEAMRGLYGPYTMMREATDEVRTNIESFGVGAQYSLHFVPNTLEPVYGSDPESWLIFARYRVE